MVSVQSCGQNRYRGGYPYPPRAPRAKNGVRGRETPSPSPEPRRRRLLSCVQAAPPAGCEPRTSPAGTVRGVVPLHSSPERHRDRVPDRPLHAAETDHNRREIPPIPPRCCHTFVLLHTRLNSYTAKSKVQQGATAGSKSRSPGPRCLFGRACFFPRGTAFICFVWLAEKCNHESCNSLMRVKRSDLLNLPVSHTSESSSHPMKLISS